jgi:hypothetical protein
LLEAALQMDIPIHIVGARTRQAVMASASGHVAIGSVENTKSYRQSW